MVSLGYAGSELRRRWSRTVVTALGLAAGVGLVMGIIGVSDGLTRAQSDVLSPLSSVGTDIIVTRTVGATTTATGVATATPSPSAQNNGGFGGGGGAGGGFFAPGGGGGGNAATQLTQLNDQDQTALLNANSSVLTDLSKLGPAGTKFTHDFFVPGTLITFPQAALQTVTAVAGVQSAVPALSLQAVHETGTVPQITDTVTTGGQTVTSVQTPAPLNAAERQQVFACIEANGGFSRGGSNATPGPRPTPGPGGAPDTGRFGSAFQKCLPQRLQQYVAQVVVPAQTINRILNPPATDTQTKTYTVGGVNHADPNTGLVTATQVVSGSWFTSSPASQVLVNSAYASRNGIKAGQTLSINGTTFTVVGLVNPTLTGNISDIYFDLATLQSMSTNPSRVNEILVKVASSDNVDSVAAAIHNHLPGAQVLTAKSLANQVSGSLADAHTLASSLGVALAVIILLAAFLLAALLTTSSVSKRVHEIGTLRAIGWRRARVVRQIMAETVGIGVLGAVVGVLIGFGVAAAVNHFGPTLTSTTTGNSVGASTVASIFHQTSTVSANQSVHLQSVISWQTVLLGIAFALLGGLVAGMVGGWRASRLAPATALRHLG
ncbi:MAG: FtsX-like permease family protein [Candidatus Dormibacteraeota bacterium]|nr:FtsX-like permease family protein [Candidatus Dormibacteraeota bacterium]